MRKRAVLDEHGEVSNIVAYAYGTDGHVARKIKRFPPIVTDRRFFYDSDSHGNWVTRVKIADRDVKLVIERQIIYY